MSSNIYIAFNANYWLQLTIVVGDLTDVLVGWWADVFSRLSDHRFRRHRVDRRAV